MTARHHLADPTYPNDAAHKTFCGRLTAEVVYWSSPALAFNPQFGLDEDYICRTCVRANVTLGRPQIGQAA